MTELGTKADPDRDEIQVDGRRLKTAPVKSYLLRTSPRRHVHGARSTASTNVVICWRSRA